MEENELYYLLYSDEDGEIVGLDEVQLLDPIPNSRIPLLLSYLDKEDEYTSYQIALVLASWGRIEGINWLINRIETKPVNEVLDTDRYGERELFFDKTAEAAYFFTLSEGDRIIALNLIDKLLDRFFQIYLNGRFKNALLKLEPRELESKINNPNILRRQCWSIIGTLTYHWNN